MENNIKDEFTTKLVQRDGKYYVHGTKTLIDEWDLQEFITFKKEVEDNMTVRKEALAETQKYLNELNRLDKEIDELRKKEKEVTKEEMKEAMKINTGN